MLALGLAGAALAVSIDYSFAQRGTSEAVAELLSRVLRRYRPLESLSAAESAVLEQSTGRFELSIVQACTEPPPPSARSALCFSMSGGGNATVKIAATSGPDLARGVATYLRATSAYSFSWNRTGGIVGPPASIAKLPTVWPAVAPTTQYRNTDVSYYQNVVASSYSQVWWTTDDWQRMNDWMALSGINVALLYGATELVERTAFAAFGIDDATFGNWSNAPAWFAWSRGQSMHGVGENINNAATFTTFLSAQRTLARWRLAQMRALGIVAVLPAFQGNVPPRLAALHPGANLTVQGSGRHYAAWLDALDPLFAQIGDAWMTALRRVLGMDSAVAPVAFDGCWFEADGYFTSGRPPWMDARDAPPLRSLSSSKSKRLGVAGDADAARLHVEQAYMAINRTVPAAVMIYQGWTLGGDDDFTRGLVAAVPLGRLVISDMRCEDGNGGCEWTDRNFSFNGAPFIWGTLHNFGGVLGMWGSLPELASNATFAFNSPHSTVAGVGAYPEGVNQNPVFYNFLYDLNWQRAAPTRASRTATAAQTGISSGSLEAWLQRYAIERYALDSSESAATIALAQSAWKALGDTVYSDDQGLKNGNDFCSASDGLTSYPIGAEQEGVGPQPAWYDEDKVWGVWTTLIELAAALGGDERIPTTLRYDIVNVGRECLAKRSNALFAALEAAGQRGGGGSAAAVRSASEAMGALQRDADALLSTDAAFSLGRWVGAARASLPGASAEQKQWLAWQARAQVTTWLPACAPDVAPGWPSSNTTKGSCGSRSDLADYANKQWGGLIETFYAERMACYASSGASRVDPRRSPATKQWEKGMSRPRETKNSRRSHARSHSATRGGAAFALNTTAYNVCIDEVSYAFQNGDVGNAAAWPWTSGKDTLLLSKQLLAKWRPTATSTATLPSGSKQT